MNIECGCCGERVEIDRFALLPDAIEITCPACSQRYTVPATPRAEDTGAATACPKCEAPAAPDATACARCGLLRERWDQFAIEADADPDPVLLERWQACETEWDDPATHDRFADAAVAAGAFAYAARRYREAVRRRPQNAIARGRLERWMRMTEAAFLVAPTHSRAAEPAEREPYRNVVLLLVAIIVAGAAAGVYFWLRKGI